MPPVPRRRWFRWSLRTLFVAWTLFGLWLSWQLHIVRERNRMLAILEPMDVFVTKSDLMRQDILDYYRRNPGRRRKALSH